MPPSTTGQSYTAWKKQNPNGSYAQWNTGSAGTPAPSIPSAPQTPSVAPVKNFTVQYDEAKKSNPNLTSQEFEKTYTQNNAGGAALLDAAKAKNQALAKTNQQKAQEQYIQQGGVVKQGEVYDPYASLQKAAQTGQAPQGAMAQGEADLIRKDIGGIANYKTPIAQQKNYGNSKNTYSPGGKLPTPPDLSGAETPEESLQMQLNYQAQLTDYEKNQKQGAFQELGSVSGQVSDFASQMQAQQQQVQDLVNSLNSKKNGLGDEVNSILDEMAQSGVQADLTPETFKMLESMALDTPADQIDDKIMSMAQSQPAQEPQPLEAQQAPEPVDIPIPQYQEYASLKQSGLNAGQIIQQNPSMMSQVVPDGSIINSNTGVGIVQTPLGEAYKTPSGLIVPKDSTTGFYNLSAMTPDQITKMSFADLMAIDLSTKKTSSDMKAFYTAQTLQKMSQKNDREYGIAQADLQSFYNSENNRLNESQVKAAQEIEIEKMRQNLSKDTSIQQLNESKSKAANMMKAQMDAWGLEGSSIMISSQIAQSNKFEQEISNVNKSYDINIMQLTMASTQTQMEFTNRVTELNQKMQVQKMSLTDNYLGKQDEIENSVLMSKIAQEDEKNNMYLDYVGKIYDNEQQAQAAAAAAEKEAQAETWEKQKYYSEQMGMLVSVGQDGSINPLLSEDGNPIETMEGKKFSLEGMKFGWEQEKYTVDADLRERQFQQDQVEFGIDADLRQQTFNQNVQEFGMTYALQQDKQAFDQNMDVSKFNQNDEQFYAGMKGFDMKVDENGDNIGTNKMGEVVNFGQGPSVAVPIKSKFAYNVVNPNEIRFNIPPGKMKTRGECGMLVNDALNGGPGLMGDSYESKMGVVNSKLPVAGGAFVEKINGLASGHTGLVEKVYPDGSFDIRESNYHGKWTVSTETITPGTARWKTIVEGGGFYDPVKGGSSTSKKEKGVSGDGAFAKFVQQQVAQGQPQKDAVTEANKRMSEGTLPGMEKLDQAKEEKKQNVLNAISKLKNSKGLGASVGVKGVTNYIPGTEAANFQAQFKNLESLLTLENLGVLKGAISDKDMEVLKSAATSLNMNMSEKEFRKTIDEMEAKLSGGKASPPLSSAPKKPGIFAGPQALVKYAIDSKAYKNSQNTITPSKIKGGYTLPSPNNNSNY